MNDDQVAWTKHTTNHSSQVIALAEGTHAIAIASSNHKSAGKVTSQVLARTQDGWTSLLDTPGRLSAIHAMADGSVIAAGNHLSCHYRDGRWDFLHPDADFRHVWGAAFNCAYAFAEDNLLHFDGAVWRQIDLEGLDIQGAWADGSCDSAGRSWIVGTWGSHSCMATGVGMDWRGDGCGSFYLYKVAVDDGGHAFAAGGDGLWRYVEDRWERVEEYGHGTSRLPLAILCSGASCVVVACQLKDFVLGGRGGEQSTAALDVFIVESRRRITTPVSLSEELVVSLSPGGYLVIGKGEAI